MQIEFYEPENWLNLAWTCVLARDRRRANEAILRGLAMDSRHAGLRELAQRLGLRRPPVISFLPRGHALNATLGRWRASVLLRSLSRQRV